MKAEPHGSAKKYDTRAIKQIKSPVFLPGTNGVERFSYVRVSRRLTVDD
jgi:hypothetical protein